MFSRVFIVHEQGAAPIELVIFDYRNINFLGNLSFSNYEFYLKLSEKL